MCCSQQFIVDVWCIVVTSTLYKEMVSWHSILSCYLLQCHPILECWFLSLRYSISIQVPANEPAKATDDSLNTWAIATYVGFQDKVPDCWLWLGQPWLFQMFGLCTRGYKMYFLSPPSPSLSCFHFFSFPPSLLFK